LKVSGVERRQRWKPGADFMNLFRTPSFENIDVRRKKESL
jgi:hypothetical protein